MMRFLDLQVITSIHRCVLHRKAMGNKDVHLGVRQLVPSSDVLFFQEGFQHEDGGTQMSRPSLLRYIQGMVAGPSELPLNIKNSGKTHFSQANQSQTVDHILHELRGGYFVECGAGNGESLSNSLFFERERNWTGLLVEANPEFYSKILHTNRKVFSINACLSPTKQPQMVTFDIGSKMMGGIVEYAGNEHYKNINNTSKKVPKFVNVQCFPLFSIMKALGVDHINYFSLDVEGPELNILKTIPWDKLRIDVLTVEYQMQDIKDKLQKLHEIRQHFDSTGLYEEADILSIRRKHKKQKDVERHGLDLVFKRKDLQ